MDYGIVYRPNPSTNSCLLKLKYIYIYTSWLDRHGKFVFTIQVRCDSTGGNPVRSSILWVKACAGRPIWFRPLKLTFSNNNRVPGQWVTLHMQVKSEFLQLLLKNKLTDFIASVSEAVRGIFLPPPKLRPLKNVTMFTNRKRVYMYNCNLK